MCVCVCVCVYVCVCTHACVQICVCVLQIPKGFAFGIMKPAGRDEPQTQSCTHAQVTVESLALNSHQLPQSDTNTPRGRANRTHAPQHIACNANKCLCALSSRACQLRNETKQLWGLRHPLCWATYCLQSQACILYSKLGRAKPCGKCALKNKKSHTLPWKLPHTEPDRLGINSIPFCFSIYSGKI